MKRSVYIGTEAGQELAAHVLQATIEAHSGNSVSVHFLNRALQGAGLGVSNVRNSNTPFSKQRVFVPRLAQSGQAAYLDSDMLVFRDINQLFDQASPATIASCQTRQKDREPQTSVLVFEVANCAWDPQAIIAEIDADPSKYRPYLYEFTFAGGTERRLPAPWNDLEQFERSTTCLLHFTDMDTQPWITSTNQLADVWLDSLRLAADKPGTMELLRKGVRQFHIRPSLLWQVRAGWRPSADIPLWRRLMDVAFFIPPHTLVNGLPFGAGRRVAKFLESGAPRWLKFPIVAACSLVLLARRRRRLLVKATLTNRKCIINRNVAALVY